MRRYSLYLVLSKRRRSLAIFFGRCALPLASLTIEFRSSEADCLLLCVPQTFPGIPSRIKIPRSKSPGAFIANVRRFFFIDPFPAKEAECRGGTVFISRFFRLQVRIPYAVPFLGESLGESSENSDYSPTLFPRKRAPYFESVNG